MVKRGIDEVGVLTKKPKVEAESEEETKTETGFVKLDENLLYEVLKHVDAKTLAMAACVSKQWNKTAEDERLWELICTRHWVNIGCGMHKLRSVVLALGGFRRLYSVHIWPLSKSSSSSSSSSSSPWPFRGDRVIPAKSSRISRDEIHLSLSLYSISYYEKMNLSKEGR